MAPAEPLVPPQLAAFLESGLVLAVGTSDAELQPDCCLAAGLRVHPGGRAVTLYLATDPARTAIANLRANGAVAITASRPADYRTFQLKGRATRVDAVPPEERGAPLACREALVAQLEQVGWSPTLTRRVRSWPCVAVEVELAAVFEQTPGPRAGASLGGP